MRFPHHSPLGVIAAVPALFAACNADPAATMAPTTTTSFSQTSPISPEQTYSFSLSCNAAALGSRAVVRANDFLPVSLFCGQFTIFENFTSFRYEIDLIGVVGTVIEVCSATDNTTTGIFKCRDKNRSATLTVTELGVMAP